eukprot:COSAG05_NODE_3660_length_1922_cov_43.870543_1_plen_88_part_00
MTTVTLTCYYSCSKLYSLLLSAIHMHALEIPTNVINVRSHRRIPYQHIIKETHGTAEAQFTPVEIGEHWSRSSAEPHKELGEVAVIK